MRELLSLPEARLTTYQLLGLIPHALKGVFDRTSMLRVTDSLSGIKSDRISFTISGRQFLLLKNPDDIGRVLSAPITSVTHSRFQKSAGGIRANEPIISNSEGEVWKELRRNLASFMGKPGLKSGFGKDAERAVQDHILSWQSQDRVGVYEEAGRLALKYVFKALFNYNASNSQCNEMAKGINAVHNYMLLSVINLGMLPKSLIKKITRISMNTEVADHMISLLVDDFTRLSDEQKASHVFSHVLPEEIVKKMPDIDQAKIRGIINELLIAGQITNVSSLYWMLHHVARLPELQTKIRDEARNIYGEVSFRPDKEFNMPLAAKVTLETLRLHPPTFIFLKEALGDFEGDDGLHIQDKTTILIPPRLVQRDPRFYNSPMEFMPERNFSPTAMRARHRFAYLPFGHGPHNCPGSGMSLQFLASTLSEICRNYNLAVSENSIVLPKERADFALHPEEKSKILLSPV